MVILKRCNVLVVNAGSATSLSDCLHSGDKKNQLQRTTLLQLSTLHNLMYSTDISACSDRKLMLCAIFSLYADVSTLRSHKPLRCQFPAVNASTSTQLYYGSPPPHHTPSNTEIQTSISLLFLQQLWRASSNSSQIVFIQLNAKVSVYIWHDVSLLTSMILSQRLQTVLHCQV